MTVSVISDTVDTQTPIVPMLPELGSAIINDAVKNLFAENEHDAQDSINTSISSTINKAPPGKQYPGQTPPQKIKPPTRTDKPPPDMYHQPPLDFAQNPPVENVTVDENRNITHTKPHNSTRRLPNRPAITQIMKNAPTQRMHHSQKLPPLSLHKNQKQPQNTDVLSDSVADKDDKNLRFKLHRVDKKVLPLLNKQVPR